MVTIKLKNVSVKFGKKFRHNQNYTLTLYKKDGVDEDTTIDEIENIIIEKLSDKIILSKQSEIILH
jgi:hypothetical protein